MIVQKKPDYEKLYHFLFNCLTDTILALQKVQQQSESMFMEQTEVISVPEYLSKVDHRNFS